jgi:lipid A disaccharide synthetase
MVITYRQSMLNSILMRRMIYLPYIGLPNILAGEQFVPEYVQAKATHEALARRRQWAVAGPIGLEPPGQETLRRRAAAV